MLESFVCPIHGPYGDPDGRSIVRVCPACEAEANAKETAFRQKWRCWRWWLDHSGVPDRYRTRSIANWHPQGDSQARIGQAVLAYIDKLVDNLEAGAGLTLIGPPGVGKTHLATAVVNAACVRGIRAQYASWPDLIARQRQAIRAAAGHPDRTALEKAAGADLLALDEAGLDTGSEWARAALFELIDHRYREERATIVALNATAKGLPDQVGERVADRLVEMAPTLVLTGASQRPNAKASRTPAIDPPPSSITVTVCDSGEMVDRVVEYRQAGSFAGAYL